MIEIIPLIILSLASYRLTRFLVIDTLIEGLRNKFHSFLVNKAQKRGKLHLLYSKLYSLTSCTWCFGTWLSLAIYSLYLWTAPWDFGRADLINVLAITAIQGLLHAFEPDDA